MNTKKLLISITTIICLALLITACYFVFYRSFDEFDEIRNQIMSNK